MKSVGRNLCSIPSTNFVSLLVVLMLGHECTAVFTLPQDQQNMKLILRDKVSRFAPLHAQKTRSLLECSRVCAAVPKSFIITFLPNAEKNCLCQNFRGVKKRDDHVGARTYQSKFGKFMICLNISLTVISCLLFSFTVFT